MRLTALQSITISETEIGLWLRPNWSSGICEKWSCYCQWPTGRRQISNFRSKLTWLETTAKKNLIQDFWELQTTSTCPETDQSTGCRMEMELVGSLSICYCTKTAKAENKPANLLSSCLQHSQHLNISFIGCQMFMSIWDRRSSTTSIM